MQITITRTIISDTTMTIVPAGTVGEVMQIVTRNKKHYWVTRFPHSQWLMRVPEELGREVRA